MSADLLSVSAPQRPRWRDERQVRLVRRELAARPNLVSVDSVQRLARLLPAVVDGRALVVQAGDCAETFTECTSGYVRRKAGILDVLAGILKITTHLPVVRVGRIAGQFAKPRSSEFELVSGIELPAYRGDAVNSSEPDPHSRRADPRRMLSGYDAAEEVMQLLGWRDPEPSLIEPPVWTSHEALLLDYEVPQLRRGHSGETFLASTHWPWIGDRTRTPSGPHVALLAGIANPVACKVGPSVTVEELIELCDRLDPARQPGRLTLIARLGAEAVATRLPTLVRAVLAWGHPVIWLTDPMHGNTIRTPGGLKTRFVDTIIREVRDFQVAVRSAGGVAGGLHLETTPDDVTECVRNASEVDGVSGKYTSLCDPRLTLSQAVSVVSAWSG